MPSQLLLLFRLGMYLCARHAERLINSVLCHSVCWHFAPTLTISCRAHAREILLGKSLRLKHGWVAVVNRGQADINKKMTMNEARGKENEFFKGVDSYRWEGPGYAGAAGQVERHAGICVVHI